MFVFTCALTAIAYLAGGSEAVTGVAGRVAATGAASAGTTVEGSVAIATGAAGGARSDSMTFAVGGGLTTKVV